MGCVPSTCHIGTPLLCGSKTPSPMYSEGVCLICVSPRDTLSSVKRGHSLLCIANEFPSSACRRGVPSPLLGESPPPLYTGGVCLFCLSHMDTPSCVERRLSSISRGRIASSTHRGWGTLSSAMGIRSLLCITKGSVSSTCRRGTPSPLSMGHTLSSV